MIDRGDIVAPWIEGPKEIVLTEGYEESSFTYNYFGDFGMSDAKLLDAYSQFDDFLEFTPILGDGNEMLGMKVTIKPGLKPMELEFALTVIYDYYDLVAEINPKVIIKPVGTGTGDATENTSSGNNTTINSKAAPTGDNNLATMSLLLLLMSISIITIAFRIKSKKA